jgi:GrpB-like predicted nucleotidyltransferase (UPF0157 family)
MDNEAHPILGLERGLVRLHDHDDAWAQLYSREMEAINAAVGSRLIEIRHYGSTAMQGIKAKPILDMVAGVEPLDAALDFIEPLVAIGYEYVPDAGVPEHHVFSKGSPQTHLLHFTQYGGHAWVEALMFYSAVTKSPILARRYEALKLDLANKFADNRPAYTAGKADFIRRVIAGK